MIPLTDGGKWIALGLELMESDEQKITIIDNIFNALQGRRSRTAVKVSCCCFGQVHLQDFQQIFLFFSLTDYLLNRLLDLRQVILLRQR